MDTVMKMNNVFIDDKKRPLQNIRIRHVIILDDPFEDPKGLNAIIPSHSPEIKYDELDKNYIPDDIDLEKVDNRPAEEKNRELREGRAKADSTLLEVLRDISHRDIKPDENTLFVCQLNPITTDEDLHTIFAQFGAIVSCEVVRDYKTGDSLQYAFVEFEKKAHCEMAFLKMNNVLLDDRRIKVDWSQSVARQWEKFNKGDRSMVKGRRKRNREAV